MGLLEDPAFKAKYTKSKFIVRQWENDFMKRNGTNPTKADIQVAATVVKDAYKTYYKLKTLALEESLKDAFVEDVENTSIYENPELQCQSNVFEFKSQDLSEKSKHFRTALKDIQNEIESSEDGDLKKGLPNEEAPSKDTVWGHHLNKSNICQKKPSTIKHSTSAKFTDKLFVASKFNKRNPRKMRIPNSSETKTEKAEKNTKSVNNFSSVSDQSISKSLEVDTEPPTSALLIDSDQSISKSLEVDTDPPTSALLIDNVTSEKKYKLTENVKPVTYKAVNIIHRTIMDVEQPIMRERRIDKGWLDRCVEVDDTCLQEKVDTASENKEVENDYTASENLEMENVQMNSSGKIKDFIDSDDDVVCNSESEDEMRSKIKFSYKRKFSCISDTKSNNEEGVQVKKVKLGDEQFSEKLQDEDKSNTVDSGVTSKSNEENEHSVKNEHLSNVFTAENCQKIAKQVVELENSNSSALKKVSRPTTKKAILEDKVKSGKANENFVRINLKKKVYVRGKKTMNATKYKIMEWKKKKKENAGYKTSHEGMKKCFKCGDIGHFAKNCQSAQKGDKLLPLDDEFDDSPFPTLDEVAAMAAEPIFYSKRRNVLEQTSCSSVGDSNDEIDSNYSSFGLFSQTVEPVYSLNEDGSVKDTPLEVLVALQKFGHKSFRPGQEEAIMRILSGLSTLVVLSTGSGKSLCYQLPAYLFSQKRECITIVISPLVSLMEDQVTGTASCVKIACLHTNQTPKQRQDVIDMAKAKKLQILLISPEAIISGERTNGFGSILKDLPPIAFACIDEAHCISQWSHNFRPSYLMICRVLKEKFNVKTILGLTATATKSTSTSILQQISIPDGEQGIVQDVPLPDNLILSVSQDSNRDRALVSLLQNTHFKDCDSVIIYCTRRQECDRLAVLIRTVFQDSSRPESTAKRSRISWNAESYHAGLSAARRKMVQKSFMSGKVRIVVATVAFGMGINKPDIRAVIHYNMPCSFESYVQEVGRAGRDGLPAFCHLFLEHEGSDKSELRRHIYANSVDRHVLRKLLQRVFVPCKCQKIADLLEGVDLNNTDDCETKSNTGNQLTTSENIVKCPGHEVAFSVEDTVQTLDIPQENIETLLCYLELHEKGWIKVLSPVYTTCKVTSYKGAAALKAAVKKSPPLAMAVALDQCRGVSHEKSTKLEFDVVKIAASIDWDSGKVKHHLKQLEWTKVDDKWRRTGITVEFMDLGFRVNAPGILSPTELDDTLDSLADRVLSQERNALEQLHSVFSALSSVAVPNHTDISDSSTSENNQKLKTYIRNYFSRELVDNQFEAEDEITPEQLTKYEEQVSADVRRLVCSYRNSSFTGRSVARIFHGIQSPCFPAQIWGRCKFWRAHLHLPFRYLCQIATREILSLR